MWYGPLGLLLTWAIGIVVSLSTGGYNLTELNENLLSPCIRSLITKKCRHVPLQMHSENSTKPTERAMSRCWMWWSSYRNVLAVVHEKIKKLILYWNEFLFNFVFIRLWLNVAIERIHSHFVSSDELSKLRNVAFLYVVNFQTDERTNGETKNNSQLNVYRASEFVVEIISVNLLSRAVCVFLSRFLNWNFEIFVCSWIAAVFSSVPCYASLQNKFNRINGCKRYVSSLWIYGLIERQRQSIVTVDRTQHTFSSINSTENWIEIIQFPSAMSHLLIGIRLPRRKWISYKETISYAYRRYICDQHQHQLLKCQCVCVVWCESLARVNRQYSSLRHYEFRMFLMWRSHSHRIQLTTTTTTTMTAVAMMSFDSSSTTFFFFVVLCAVRHLLIKVTWIASSFIRVWHKRNGEINSWQTKRKEKHTKKYTKISFFSRLKRDNEKWTISLAIHANSQRNCSIWDIQIKSLRNNDINLLILVFVRLGQWHPRINSFESCDRVCGD